MTRLASRSSSGSRWIPTALNDGIAAGLGFGLAALGCYAEGVPLCLALAGFVPIALSKRSMQRFAIALGWHAAPALPAAVGIWNLGEGSCGPGILVLGGWLATAAVFALLNTGVAVAISLLLPWHIGSVVLAAGDFWPGTGFGGIALTILTLGGLSAATTFRSQALVTAIAASLAATAWASYSPAPPSGFEEMTVTPPPALTTAKRDRALMKELRARSGDVLIMGENVIDRREPGALERWCNYAERHDVLLYAGVLERNERSAIHEFNPEHCAPAPVYERRFGLPGIPGGWGVGAGEIRRTSWDGRPIHWLICFETFAPVAWIMSAVSPGAIVVVVANDNWTRPVPVEILRRKVVHSMARLWNSATVFAAAGQSVGIGHPGDP
ncbi:MAG: hypothetical protein OXF88_25020 [Rhodobacteraceae bacterium]|nr:hypothetical protein [Paracoccaceae bacterium]MCY4141386.1 hypothetical protein [Paracoccaceae bacterium]